MRKRLRSLVFNLAFWSWTALICVMALPFAPFMRADQMRRYAAIWEHGVHRLLAVLVGLRHQVVGLENLPPGPVLLACKHQSAWETIAFHTIKPDIIFGMKEELSKIPIFGWYLMIAGNIKIDRDGAGKALKSLVRGGKSAIAQRISVLVFPEGTRTAPGDPPDYKPGVAALYKSLGVPCVPIALNSGVFWGRNKATKSPGVITVEFLPAIPPGMERQAFMAELQERIETATDRLVAAAKVS